MEILPRREAVFGVIVQYGGRRRWKLARRARRGRRAIIGHEPGLDRRRRGSRALPEARGPAAAEAAPIARARTEDEAVRLAAEVGFRRLSCGPSYVLGGRAMEVRLHRERPSFLHDHRGAGLERTVQCCSIGSSTSPSRSTWTRFATAKNVYIGGSWSTSSRPASTRAIPDARCRQQPQRGVAGADSRPDAADGAGAQRHRPDERCSSRSRTASLYLARGEPRASRTAPFVSKATGVRWQRPGARVIDRARTLAELGLTRERVPKFFSVKEAVFPFGKSRTPTRSLAQR